MRTHYPDSKGGLKKMSYGKMIAQGAHASMAFMSSRAKHSIGSIEYYAKLAHSNPEAVLDQSSFSIKFTEAERHWLKDSFAKVCLKVKTEEELEAVYKLATEAGLETNMIVDSGRTEFNGVPTKTCIAIGPDWCDEIDKVVRDLKLL